MSQIAESFQRPRTMLKTLLQWGPPIFSKITGDKVFFSFKLFFCLLAGEA